MNANASPKQGEFDAPTAQSNYYGTALRLSAAGVEKLAAAIVAGMIREASYRGEEVTAGELAVVMTADPTGATAGYFRQAAHGSLTLISKFQADPELLEIFGGQP